MRRSLVYGVAGAALGLAFVLTLVGAGDDPDALTNGQAFVLGIVQGITELLPISSSGHLILVPWAAEWTFLENDRFNQTFDVALHLGTLVAVASYFWRDIVRLGRAFGASVARRRIDTPDQRIAWFVLVATIPAGMTASWARTSSRTSSATLADRDPPRGRRDPPLVGRPRAASGRWETSGSGMRSPWASRRRLRSPRRVPLRDHDHRRPADAPRPGRRGALRSCSCCPRCCPSS